MFLYLIVMSKNAYWHGDWAWGPRYLLVITPFLLIPAAHILDSGKWLRNELFKKTLYFIFFLSFVIQIAAVSVDFRKYFITLEKEEKVNFTLSDEKGVPSIYEPPLEVYFDWRKSPILAQLKFICNLTAMATKHNYLRSEIITDKVKIDPHMIYFDFWWYYRYVLTGSYIGFLQALVLLLLAVCAAVTIFKAARVILDEHE